MIYKGTSEPEQSIYYYVKRYFPDAINRYVYRHDNSNSNGTEIDVYIPSINVAIEYDGGFWHDKKAHIDILKNLYLNQNGIFVMRVRDTNLPVLSEFNGVIFYHGKAPKGMHTNECIESIIHELAAHCNKELLAKELHNFSLSFEQYIKDLPDIIGGMFPVKVKNNKSKFCGAECWDNTANGRLKLQNIPADSQGFYVNLKCKNGKSIHTTINCLIDKKKCKIKCSECFNQICLFNYYCQEVDCPVITQYISNYLFGIVDNILDSNSNAYKNIFQTSWAIDLIKLRLNNDNTEFSNRFNKLFGYPRFGRWSIIKITSIEDLQIVKDYADRAGGLVNFNLAQLDSSEGCISLLGNYFSIVRELLYKYMGDFENHSIYSSIWYYIESIYFDWKRHRAELNSDLQNMVIGYLKSIDNSQTHFNFKFD